MSAHGSSRAGSGRERLYYGGPQVPLEMKEKSAYWLKRKSIFVLDPNLLPRIKKCHFKCGSKLVTTDPKLLRRIQSCNYGSKVITTDPKFYPRIQSYNYGSNVVTTDPTL